MILRIKRSPRAQPADTAVMASDAPLWQTIELHRGAPPKPAPGAPCNGCGVCCAAEPCPIGMVVSRRRHGRCSALRWDAAARRYHCGLVGPPKAGANRGRWAHRWLSAVARRLISAGSGCDASLEVVAVSGAD